MNEESKQSKPIGRRIRQLRKQEGMNIRELAEKVGISRSYLSQIELESVKSPTIGTVRKIAGALDLNVSELLGEEGARKNSNTSSFDFPLSKEELDEISSEESTPSYLVGSDIDPDTLEALETLKNIMTDPKVPIQQIDDIRSKIISYAKWLQEKARQNEVD